MIAPVAPSTARIDRLAAAAAALAVAALMVGMTHWVGEGSQPVTAEAFWTLTSALPLPLMWLAAAIGLGWPMRRWLAPESANGLALQVGLGVAAMLIIDASLAPTGALAVPVIAWLLPMLGVALLIAQLLRLRRDHMPVLLPHWVFWSAAPAIAVLLLAACSAPGWLWSSEFGGYDALAYHLQLPKEWLAAGGAATPLEHNVYSFLPGYVEAAYLHLMALRGGDDAVAAAYDCQALHGLLTLLAAGMIGAMTSRIAGGSRFGGAAAAALTLSVPWTIVVGSLAYNEMAVNLLFASALLAVLDENLRPAKQGLIVGLLCAAAVGAKLTAVGFVVAPVAMAIALRAPRRQWLATVCAAAIAGGVALMPYVVRNAVHAGNPLFPFAAGLFGTAHWTAEQAEIWQRGHVADATPAQRLLALWQQFSAYGFGGNPAPGEPWKPQWSVLPWLGLLGGVVALARPAQRRSALLLLAVVIVQVGFWIVFTHLKSRFLLPAAVPLCALAVMGVSGVLQDRAQLAPRAAAIAMFALALLPMWIFRTERGNAPALAIGTIAQQTGDALTERARLEIGASIMPAVAVNHLLPPTSRVLLVGDAAPLYMRSERSVYSTVWDRGPLSRIAREQPSDPEAWRQELRALGFSHLLIMPEMLDRWQRSGWNDPLITRRSVIDFAERACVPLFDYPNDVTIYELPE